MSNAQRNRAIGSAFMVRRPEGMRHGTNAIDPRSVAMTIALCPAALSGLFLFGDCTMRLLFLLGGVVGLVATGAFAHDRHGNPNWIANGHYTSPIDGSHCCGVADCFEVPASDVQETNGGYLLIRTNEVVPAREVQTSKDGNYWRCKKPDGSRRCFFAPPGAV
jgi:hypothetical protein